MNCKCGYQLQDGWKVCPVCGRRTVNYRSTKKRGNGQGTVLKTANGKYKAVVTLGYYLDEQGHLHRRTATKVFDRRTDAINALPSLKTQNKTLKADVTFKGLYDAWLPTHKASKDTMNCYKAAFQYFRPVWLMKMDDITIDDLQDCLDECPHGKRTRQNMKTLCGLMYKHGIPRKQVPDNINLAEFLRVEGESSSQRDSLTDIEIEKIRLAVGRIDHADEIYAMIYLGFRPSEFLSLRAEDYFPEQGYIIGGAKTEAGTNRTVTISPKIRSIIDAHAEQGGLLFSNNGLQWDLKKYTDEVFYPTLKKIGIDNPTNLVGIKTTRHRITPHSCRHTFATLMKRVQGNDKDKLELIGHTSDEMLRYYQDVSIADLKKITDKL